MQRVETFDYIGDDPATAPLLKQMRGPDGKSDRVRRTSGFPTYTGSPATSHGEGHGKLTTGYGSRRNPKEDGGKIGPEFTFGLAMDATFDEPVLIIKTAWGGKSPAYGLSLADRRAVRDERLAKGELSETRGAWYSEGL